MTGRNEPCPCGSGKKYKKCCGAPGRAVKPPQPARVAGAVVLDHDKKRAIMIPRETLINQLQKKGPEIAASFDAAFEGELDALADAFLRIWHLQTLASVNIARLTETQQLMVRLLLNGTNTLLAALEVLRRGYRLQPNILLRNVLEVVTTILYLAVKPSALKEYRAGKLKSQTTIGPAKKILPPLGPMYGLLSKGFAHVGEAHAWPNFTNEFERGDVPAQANLMGIRVMAFLVEMATELTIISLVEHPTYWTAVDRPAGAYAFDPDEATMEQIAAFLAELNQNEGREAATGEARGETAT